MGLQLRTLTLAPGLVGLPSGNKMLGQVAVSEHFSKVSSKASDTYMRDK